MMSPEVPLRYLFGDSTESNLEFDYLAFAREVIDCAVVMAECEVTLGVTVENRHSRELETATMITAVEELGKRVSQLVGPMASERASTPIGRCAAAIAAAIREAVDRESTQVRAALAVECDEMDKQDQRQRERAKDVLDRLLRTHDLPGADKEFEVSWTATGVRATMRQRTGFGIEAVLLLDIPANSIFGIDLRVDRIAENVEVHAHETAGWLKKSDKVVAHKLGRYQVANVVVDGDATTVRLRATPEGNATGFVITSRRNGDLSIEPTGGAPGREVTIDDRARPGLRLLAERIETAVRALTETRTGLLSVEIDGKPLAQHAHPQVLAERLIAAIAPTVQKIAQHSRSPGELVLRRLIGENRREEIFVSTAELLKRLDGLPSQAREVFAPLQLGGQPAKSSLDEPKQPARPVVEFRPAPILTPTPAAAPVPAPAERTAPVADGEPRPPTRSVASRTTPPPVLMPDARSGPNRLSGQIPSVEARRAHSPTGSRIEVPPADPSVFDDRDPSGSAARADAPATAAKPQPAPELGRKRIDDVAFSDAMERALDDEDGDVPSPK
jgi:hypothetical protein